jgi:hypothetical protein
VLCGNVCECVLCVVCVVCVGGGVSVVCGASVLCIVWGYRKVYDESMEKIQEKD